MELREYQEKARETAIYDNWLYPVLGLTGEAGEVSEKYKKLVRDKQGEMTELDKFEIAKELGDVLWYVSNLAQDLGYSLEDVARINIEKLDSRKNRGVLGGSGDNR